jgi:iron complex outermembrane receptor protein
MPHATAYALFSNGYQTAALNLNAVIKSGIPAVVKPSMTNSYEIRSKTTLFDHHLALNADVFDEMLGGYQATYSQILASGATLRYVANAGNVHSRSVEWGASAALGHGVLLSFDGAYNDAVFAYAPSVAPPPEVTSATYDATGRAAPDAPRLTLSLTPSWEREINDRDHKLASNFLFAVALAAVLAFWL